MQINLTLNIDDRIVSFLKRSFTRRKVMLAFAVACVASAVVDAASIPNTFSAGQVVSASAMNANFSALTTAVTGLEGKSSNWDAAYGWGNHATAGYLKVVPDLDCPPGYTKNTGTTSFTLCVRGNDQMVKVGDFWVDRYETSIMDTGAYNGGKCDGTGVQYGAGTTDDYPTTPGKGFPDSASFSVKLYACSRSGNVPSRNMTWFQAAAACALSGKHLCTNGEWQVAAFGTPDDSTSCNISTSAEEKAGNRAACVSAFGANDMVGNLWEWVDLWWQAGKSWMTTGAEKATPWPSGYGDGQDATWNIDGQSANPGWSNGSPAAVIRGGGSGYGADAGVFAMGLNSGPSAWLTIIGARCCRR